MFYTSMPLKLTWFHKYSRILQVRHISCQSAILVGYSIVICVRICRVYKGVSCATLHFTPVLIYLAGWPRQVTRTYSTGNNILGYQAVLKSTTIYRTSVENPTILKNKFKIKSSVHLYMQYMHSCSKHVQISNKLAEIFYQL